MSIDINKEVAIWRITPDEPNGKLFGTGDRSDGSERRLAAKADKAANNNSSISVDEVDSYLATHPEANQGVVADNLKEDIIAAQDRWAAVDAATVALRPLAAAATWAIGAIFWSGRN